MAAQPDRAGLCHLDDADHGLCGLARLAARRLLAIGISAARFSVLIGIPLGAISGYYGGALTGGGFVTIVLIAAQALGATPGYIMRRHRRPVGAR